MSKYVIGVDFGSLSGRGVLVDAADGRLIASHEMEYPHGVMDRALPDGTPLRPGWALQHPQDYLDVLDAVLPALSRQVDGDEIIGVGIDCTSATVLPVSADGTPLCFMKDFQSIPQSYVMMWKHHGGQEQARRMTELAQSTGQPWLSRYGGKINAEWLFPKLLEVLEEAPQVYEAMAHYVEAADWLVWQLCGRLTRSAGCLGYKALYTGGQFPRRDYFAALNPRFADAAAEKLSGPVLALGSPAGGLTPFAAERYGLREGTVLAAGNIDAHVCVPAAGIDGSGKLLAIIGTSTCHIVMSDHVAEVPGMSGVVEGGVLPGYQGYEAGQSSVGDQFRWFEENQTPAGYAREAEKRHTSVQGCLTELAQSLRPGQSGLLALDWWNGNRSVLADADLSGMMLGMTLRTRPEEIYRALLESTAYGARMILEGYRESGVEVKEFYASGGIPHKNPLAMQIYADVLHMPVRITGSAQGPALGSAIFAAVAAGGHESIFRAVSAMSGSTERVYQPDSASAAIYEKLYQEYKRLHDYFGRGENDVMKRLKALQSY